MSSSLAIKRVLLLDGIDASCGALLAQHGIDGVDGAALSREQVLKDVNNYEAIVVRSATQVDKAFLDACSRLKLVARAGAGVDNINVATAGQKNIAVINAPGANAPSACELSCCLVLMLARHVYPATEALKQGNWRRKDFMGVEVGGKTLAIIGLGRVGREVAVRMQAFGMKTVGYDPFLTEEQCKAFNVTKMELEEIWPIADYITLHTPLIPATKYMLNSETFKKCKKGVRIINVGRGGLVKEDDLLSALASQTVGGVALDVYETEPPTKSANPTTMELLKHPNVICTPHLGASTVEAQDRVATEIAEQIVNLVKPGTFKTPLAEVTKVLHK